MNRTVQRDAAGETMSFVRLIMLTCAALAISCGSTPTDDSVIPQVDDVEWATDCENGKDRMYEAIAAADNQSDLAPVQQWLDTCTDEPDDVDLLELESVLFIRSSRRWQAHVVMMDFCPVPWHDFQPLSLNVTVEDEAKTIWGEYPEIMERRRQLEAAYKVACWGGTPDEYLEVVKVVDSSVREAHKELLDRILTQFYWDTFQRKKPFSLAHHDLRETYPLSLVLGQHPLFLENFLFGGGNYALIKLDLAEMHRYASPLLDSRLHKLPPRITSDWYGTLSPAQLRQVHITPEQYKEAVRNVLSVFTTPEQRREFIVKQIHAGQDEEAMWSALYDSHRVNGEDRAAFDLARDLSDQRRIREMEEQAMRELDARGEYIIVVDRHGNESRGYDLSKWQ